MPIDWEAIVAPFRAVFTSQMKDFTASVQKIAKWLEKRLKAAQNMELLSRAYPVIDFEEGSVRASVALFQQHTLGLPKATGGPRPEDEYLSAWQRFARGFQRIPDAVEEALAIPRVVGVVEDILGTIVASLERWEKPDWRMFDTKQPRSFSDLFGEVFLFAEMLAMSVDPIRVVLNSEVAHLLMQPSKGAKSDSGDALAEVVRYMMSALLLVPIGGMWIASVLRWGLLSVKVTVLEFFTGIEDMLYSMRRKALEFVMGGLVNILDGAYTFIEGAKALLLLVISRVLDFGVEVLRGWTNDLREFLYSVSHFFLRGVGMLFAHILGALDGIMKINVLKMYTHGAVSGTVQELVDIVTKKDKLTYFALRADILAYGQGLGRLWDQSLPGRIWPKHIGERADALNTIVGILGNLPDKKIPAVNLPGPASKFPNIYEYLTTLNKVDMAGSLTSLRGTLETQLPAMLDSAGDALTKMGDEMAASAGNMAWIGPASDATRVRDFADSTAAMFFGDQEKELRAALKHDALAAAFDSAVASGGFHLVGAAIPLYIESMREFWEQQPPSPPHPTSPHILAKRQRLGRVKVPAVRIVTAGRALDDPLISRVAAEFRRAVQGAWQSGLRATEAGA
jgi:hypothetical protein